MKDIASALAVLLFTAAAAAEPTLSVLQQAGLMGTWARSCRDPVSPTNPYVTYYATESGTVRRRIEIRPNVAAEAAIDQAEIMTPTTVRFRMRLEGAAWGAKDGLSLDTINEIVDDRVRNLLQQAEHGTPEVKDGVIISTGKPTDGYQRCSTKPYS
jgi:hypothetical protein